MKFFTPDMFYLLFWATIGSVMGFLAFRFNISRSPLQRLFNCFVSVGIGVFIAFPLYEYLDVLGKFPTKTNIIFAGLGAFGIPDILLRYYSKISEAIVNRIVYKVSGSIRTNFK